MKRLLPLLAILIGGCNNQPPPPAKFATLDEWSVKCPGTATWQHWSGDHIDIYLDPNWNQVVIIDSVPYANKTAPSSFQIAEQDAKKFANALGATATNTAITHDGRSHIHCTLTPGPKPKIYWAKGLKPATLDTFLGDKSRLYIVSFVYPDPKYKDTVSQMVLSAYTIDTGPAVFKFQ